MSDKNKNNLGKILKQRRLIMPLTLQELSAKSGVSLTHLGRIENGQRFPSAYILRKIAKPLGFEESELFSEAGFLSPKSPIADNEAEKVGRLDPYVSAMLLKESLETQRAVVAILSIMKAIVKR